MHIDILTLFPEMFDGPLTESILKRAQEKKILTIRRHNIRDYTTDKHRTIDDTPYGGGGGMVMMVEPLVKAVETIRGEDDNIPVILLTPQGRVFTQAVAQELAAHPRLTLVCGRYEGVDERVRQHVISDEISIGDYVLSGGELAAMVVVDAVVRLLPGALGDEHATVQDSHATGLLEHPHYTRPPNFRDSQVPDILLSGHHANVARWRRQESLRRTWQRRSDLLQSAELSDADLAFLEQVRNG